MGSAVFSVQAIMTLQDLISGKLTAIAGKLAATGRAAAGLGVKMAALAKSMLPLVAVAGMLLLGLGGAVAKAASFEQAMSKVKAVAGGTAEDMAALRQNALIMGRDTVYSAMEAAGAQEDLAKAGLGAHQIIAAMPGVLSMAAAGDIGLSQAAETATDTMKTFRMEASQIGFIGDIMAATANRTSTDIGLMTGSLKNSSAVAASVGVSLLDLSAMIGTLADQGIKGVEAGTQLKTAMLRISAPNKDAVKQFKALGVATRDARGNILPIFDVLASLETKLAGMGTGKRADILKKIFGDDAISAINALLNRGIAKVKAFSKELAGSAGSAAETAATKLDNLKGAVKSLCGSIETLLINVGDPFLKPLTKLTQGLIKVVNVLANLADTPAGRTLSLLAGTMATVTLASAAVAAGIWALSMAGAAASWALAPLATALGAFGAPVWALLAVISLLATAWNTDFGGMKTTLTAWWDKAMLVFRGVAAVFGSLEGTTGKLQGKLAKDIQAKGLLGLVTSIGKIIFRIKTFFTELWSGIKAGMGGFGDVFAPLKAAFKPLSSDIAAGVGWLKKLLGLGAGTKLSSWAAAGKIVGKVLGLSFQVALFPLRMLIAGFSYLTALFTHPGQALQILKNSFSDIFSGLWKSLETAFPQVAVELQKLGLRIVMWCVDIGYKIAGGARDIWQAITSWFSGAGATITAALSGVGTALSGWWDGIATWFFGLDPVGWITNAFAGVGAAIMAGIEQVKTFLSGIDLSAAGAAIMSTLAAGVRSAAGSVWGAVKGAFGKVANLVPHSDAKEGPLSTLTASGRAIMTTMATGVRAAGPGLARATSAAMAGAALTLASPMPTLPDLTATASWAVAPPEVRLPDRSTEQASAGGRPGSPEAARSGRVVIQSLTVTLPNVQDGEGFKRELQRLVEQYDA